MFIDIHILLSPYHHITPLLLHYISLESTLKLQLERPTQHWILFDISNVEIGKGNSNYRPQNPNPIHKIQFQSK